MFRLRSRILTAWCCLLPLLSLTPCAEGEPGPTGPGGTAAPGRESTPRRGRSAAERRPAKTPSADPSGPWVLPPAKGPRLEHKIWFSKAAQREISYTLYTPEAYETEPERRFPVLYWLHGSGGGGAGVPEIAGRFDAAMRAGLIPPMILVFPNGLPMGMWCDWKDGSVPMETILIGELLPRIDASCRTVATREGRILEGFSMGGYGAARLGCKYPELFGAISLLGAGPLQLDFTDAPRAGPEGRDRVMATVFGDDPEYYRAQSPWRLAEQKAGQLRKEGCIRQVIGTRDETLRYNREFHRHLETLGIPHTYMELPGVRHNPREVLDALGEANWAFYREALRPKPGGKTKDEKASTGDRR